MADHGDSCACGCVPPTPSLLEMAQRRKALAAARAAEAAPPPPQAPSESDADSPEPASLPAADPPASSAAVTSRATEGTEDGSGEGGGGGGGGDAGASVPRHAFLPALYPQQLAEKTAHISELFSEHLAPRGVRVEAFPTGPSGYRVRCKFRIAPLSAGRILACVCVVFLEGG